jgi:mRNA interferase MazF
MTCNPAELALVPFPYADLQTSKKRPVLVLTAPDRHGDFIALAVTTVQPLEHALEIEPAALAKGALPRRSWVRLDKIFTLGQETVLRTFGEVTPAFFSTLLDGFCGRVGYRTGSGVTR